MTVHVFGIDITNKIKEPGHDNLGEGAPPGQNEGIPHSLQEWIQKEAGLAGVDHRLHLAQDLAVPARPLGPSTARASCSW